LGPDSPLDYVEQFGSRYIRAKMPYRAEEFRRITHKDLPPIHEETEDGFIQGMYMDGSDDNQIGLDSKLQKGMDHV
jgi:hypothetical protein